SAGEIRGNFTAGSLHRAPTGVMTIAPTALGALPTISDSAVIDGFTQPGSTANLQAASDDSVHLIELNGANAGPASGLRISAGNSTVWVLVINRFALANLDDTLGNGIFLEGAGGSTIEGNFLGTDPSGTLARPNTG